MNAARRFLKLTERFERIVCLVGFAVMAAALIADVLSRKFTGAGLLGAPQVGVLGMIAVAMFGFGLAAQQGGQLRARLLDWIFPKSWNTAVNAAADAITALAMAGLAALCAIMTLESARILDVSAVLRWPIWPAQAAVTLAFVLNALRYALFAVYPVLRPVEDEIPETAEVEERAAR